jgi:uracil DNA glycosylase
MIDPQIDSSRKEILRDEFQKPYFIEIKNFLQKEKAE